MGGRTVYGRGETVTFQVCLTYSPASTLALAFYNNGGNVVVEPGADPQTFEISAGASGDELCTLVSFTGKTGPANQGIGSASLRVTHGGDFYYSEPVTFLADAPTATPELATATTTPTNTPTPNPTDTSTPEPTATIPPSDPITITLVDETDHFPRGGTATFLVCLSSTFGASQFIQLRSGDGNVVDTNGGVLPSPGDVLVPGQCIEATMTGRTQFNRGVGPVQLEALIGLDIYYSPTVWFGS
jgi:hypothetical protein